METRARISDCSGNPFTALGITRTTPKAAECIRLENLKTESRKRLQRKARAEGNATLKKNNYI